MSLGSAALRLAAKVVGIVCIRPRDALPFWALMSQPLYARGLPPDSFRMTTKTSATFLSLWAWPSIASTQSTCGRQRVTESPGPGTLEQLADPSPGMPVNHSGALALE